MIVLACMVLAVLGLAIFVHNLFRVVNPCGGMVVDGTCTKRFGHRGRCRA